MQTFSFFKDSSSVVDFFKACAMEKHQTTHDQKTMNNN